MIEFLHDNSLVPNDEIIKIGDKVRNEITRMKSASKVYEDERSFVNLCLDEEMAKYVRLAVNKKKEMNPECIVVIGMGGSILGIKALQKSILGKDYNSYGNVKIYYAEGVDSDSIGFIREKVEDALKRKKEVIINLVSKSGNTTEAMFNFAMFSNLLLKYKKDISQNVVVCSDTGSELIVFAEKEGFETLEIPKKVGGRYSVFSPSSLFAAGLIGINIEELILGAKEMRKICLSEEIEENIAVLSAIIQYYHYKNGKNISDLFLFSDDLYGIGGWNRQLMGESIGKEFDLNGKKVLNGMTPTISNGISDLHSMSQLLLGGPKDKLVNFVGVSKNRKHIGFSSPKRYELFVKGIKNMNYESVLKCIYEGVINSFKKEKRPFVEIILKDKSERSIGALLQFKMIEIVYIAELMNVNPFGQPAVEKYKAEVRKILKK